MVQVKHKIPLKGVLRFRSGDPVLLKVKRGYGLAYTLFVPNFKDHNKGEEYAVFYPKPLHWFVKKYMRFRSWMLSRSSLYRRYLLWRKLRRNAGSRKKK